VNDLTLFNDAWWWWRSADDADDDWQTQKVLLRGLYASASGLIIVLQRLDYKTKRDGLSVSSAWANLHANVWLILMIISIFISISSRLQQ